MLWGKKIVEVVVVPETCDVDEPVTDGPYRGFIPAPGDTETEPNSLARIMYDKAKAAKERKDKERDDARAALVRHTLDNILPYVLQKIDELAETAVVQTSIQSLLPPSVNYCFETLALSLRAKGFIVGDHHRIVSWDCSKDKPLDF